MSYLLREVSRSIIEETKADWVEAVGEDIFVAEYSELFDYLAAGQPDVTRYRALLQEDENIAKAFVHIISHPNALKTKLLNVYICPRLLDKGTKASIVELYVACVIKTAEISEQDGTEIFKIYGRNDSLLSFLVDLSEVFNKVIDPRSIFKVKIAGRWLEISKK